MKRQLRLDACCECNYQKQNALSGSTLPPRIYFSIISTTQRILKPLFYLDTLLFFLGLPHASRLTGKSSLVLVLLYFVVVIAIVAVVLVKFFETVFRKFCIFYRHFAYHYVTLLL